MYSSTYSFPTHCDIYKIHSSIIRPHAKESLHSDQTKHAKGEFLHSLAHGTSYPVSINSSVGNPKVSQGIHHFCLDNHIITIILISLTSLSFYNQTAFLKVSRLYLHWSIEYVKLRLKDLHLSVLAFTEGCPLKQDNELCQSNILWRPLLMCDK